MVAGKKGRIRRERPKLLISSLPPQPFHKSTQLKRTFFSGHLQSAAVSKVSSGREYFLSIYWEVGVCQLQLINIWFGGDIYKSPALLSSVHKLTAHIPKSVPSLSCPSPKDLSGIPLMMPQTDVVHQWSSFCLQQDFLCSWGHLTWQEEVTQLFFSACSLTPTRFS